jgi:tight adherence protein B
MKRLFLTVALVVWAAAVSASSVAAAKSPVQLTPVGRLPFPDRGYVVDLPQGQAVNPSAVVVRENGVRVRDLQVLPLGSSGVHVGVVLAVDASDSMRGAPLQGAVAAARAFLAHRQEDEEAGIIAFNGAVHVLQAPTADGSQLQQSLSQPPAVSWGTRIYDALDRSLTLIDRAKLSAGSIVLLSDGADLGSHKQIDQVLKRAHSLHVRVFTVGLRSGAFDPETLQTLASRSGGKYSSASTPAGLKSIYAELGRRLSNEYLVRYRSDAPPHSKVEVAVDIENLGSETTRYTAPTPAGLAPFHRSLFSRVVLSPGATMLLSLLVAGLMALAIVAFLRPRRSTIVERVTQFAGAGRRPSTGEKRRLPRRLATIPRAGDGWMAKLDQQLEIARIDMSGSRIVLLTLGATILMIVLLAALSPIFAVLGLLTPLGAKSVISFKLRKVREEFADQLPPNLQVLASALRVGHSFIGALSVAVENAHEPSHSELQRVLTDEQLGVPVEEAVHRVAERMKSRDLDQVALLAELQRTAGGNAAEVLDTVVETLRERADVRRLIYTLTAQGRMARWILTALPIFACAGMFVLQGPLTRPLFTTGVGQAAVVIAAIMVVAGSLIIQKIVDIDV